MSENPIPRIQMAEARDYGFEAARERAAELVEGAGCICKSLPDAQAAWIWPVVDQEDEP